MQEIKKAVEEMKANHSASKAEQKVRYEDRKRSLELQRLRQYLYQPGDYKLPSELLNRFMTLEDSLYLLATGKPSHSSEAETEENLDRILPAIPSIAFRQVSRLKQLDSMVESALQDWNDHDEEGRSLPGEISSEDVGRTILRRADPSDFSAIKRLLLDNAASETIRLRHRSNSLLDVEFLFPEGSGEVSLASQGKGTALWTSSSIVLLLCRAIAAYEDPPLGCAILNVDFCMKRGRLLRVTRIGNESHLPQERLIECLHGFANCMKYELEVEAVRETPSNKMDQIFTASDARVIIDSYNVLEMGCDEPIETLSSEVEQSADLEPNKPVLQAVQEEEGEASDALSGTEDSPSKASSKPSKRSRFQ